MALKVYYFKILNSENYVTTHGEIFTTKKPTSTPTRIIMTKSEYEVLDTIWKNTPSPSDDMHEIKVKDNFNGTYDYVEVLKPIEEVVEE